MWQCLPLVGVVIVKGLVSPVVGEKGATAAIVMMAGSIMRDTVAVYLSRIGWAAGAPAQWVAGQRGRGHANPIAQAPPPWHTRCARQRSGAMPGRVTRCESASTAAPAPVRSLPPHSSGAAATAPTVGRQQRSAPPFAAAAAPAHTRGAAGGGALRARRRHGVLRGLHRDGSRDQPAPGRAAVRVVAQGLTHNAGVYVRVAPSRAA